MARRKKMVKRKSYKKSKKEDTPTGLYLVAIVGIVAVFGLVVLVMNAGGGATMAYDDLTGQAYYGGGFKGFSSGIVYGDDDDDDDDDPGDDGSQEDYCSEVYANCRNQARSETDCKCEDNSVAQACGNVFDDFCDTKAGPATIQARW